MRLRTLMMVGVVVGVVLSGGRFALAETEVDRELPVLVEEDFEAGMARWETTDPERAEPVWRIDVTEDGNRVLRVTGASAYQPPHRSPHSIAWLKDVVVGDFVLTATVQSTAAEAGGHRDMCLFWGYQGPGRFYYAHLGQDADPNSCQIFIVNDAPRTPITVDEADGTPWTDEWHKVKVVRRISDGTMEVYFDDMTEPLLTARDTTFTWGRIGLGTFDDHGNFDEVVLRGVEVNRGVGE